MVMINVIEIRRVDEDIIMAEGVEGDECRVMLLIFSKDELMAWGSSNHPWSIVFIKLCAVL